MKISHSILFACIAALCGHATSQTAAPPPPKAEAPALLGSDAEPYCIDCAPFDTRSHKQILQGLVANPYIAQLRNALYMQDVVHQAQSKAHFDNCDFSDALQYISELLADVDKHVTKAKSAMAQASEADKLSNPAVQSHLKDAFFSLGQALHGVQDFYAHTNYLEMHVKAARKDNDLKVVPVWNASGREQVSKLAQAGLKSGYVFWGFPQQCPSGSASHKELNKDSESSTSGKIRIPNLMNKSQFTLAKYLARRASVELVTYAFAKWPLLQQANGEVVAFEALVDHRELP